MAEFRLSLDQLPDAVAIVSADEQCRYVALNDAYCCLFGYQSDDLVGTSFADFQDKENIEQSRAVVELIRSGIPIDDLECRLKNAAGSYLTTSLSSRPFEFEQRSYVILSYRDIELRVSTEQHLRQSEARWRFAVEGHGDALWEWHSDKGIIYLSPRWLSMMKVDTPPLHSTIEQHMSEFSRQVLDNIIKTLTEGLQGNQSQLLREFELSCADGSKVWVVFRCCVMARDGNNWPVRIIGTARDVTEKKLKERDRDWQMARLTDSARLLSLGEMASGLAHELNQPLGIISSYAGILGRKLAEDPELLKIAKTIEEQSIRAGNIIWHMRNFSRQEKGEAGVLDMVVLLRESIDWLKADVRFENVAFDIEFPETELKVCGDKVLLQQVILNLLRNGAQSMDDLTDQPRLKVKAFVCGQQRVQVDISDRGCGLPTKLALDVYQPFYTTKSDGCGLGLVISRSILDKHDGTLWSCERKGGGTVFSFSLPQVFNNGDRVCPVI